MISARRLAVRVARRGRRTEDSDLERLSERRDGDAIIDEARRDVDRLFVRDGDGFVAPVAAAGQERSDFE